MEIKLSNILVNIGTNQKPLFEISSFEFKNNEKVLIKGASGKGKTTFLHLLSGLFTPSNGSIYIGNINILKLSEEDRAIFRRKHMGIIFQKLNLIEHLTALENIELSFNNTTSAIDALRAVGLEKKKNERTSVMSLGEQQRVAIARVLSGNPSIILADEPTSSLDEKNALDIIELLIKTNKDKTIIVVSHDHRIEKYFTRVISFEDLIK